VYTMATKADASTYIPNLNHQRLSVSVTLEASYFFDHDPRLVIIKMEPTSLDLPHVAPHPEADRSR
jgi:hypothetical protein